MYQKQREKDNARKKMLEWLDRLIDIIRIIA
jgi:hypothetical protein